MEKNPEFFYLQYNKMNWKNQEKTKINSFINDYIINNILLKHEGDSISIFDIGFGVGFFIKMVAEKLRTKFPVLVIGGCEPSRVNYEYFVDQGIDDVALTIYPDDFLAVESSQHFDYLTAIYVFPHFLFDDLETVAQKTHAMLKPNGKFILVLANEKYLQEKLDSEKDLFLESGEVEYRGNKYKQVLHYSEIPEIGKVIDYNREESFYTDLFSNNGFIQESKESLNDNGFVCSLFIFKKK